MVKFQRSVNQNLQKEVIFSIDSASDYVQHEKRERRKRGGEKNEQEEDDEKEEQEERSRLSHLRRIVCNVEDATVRAKRSHSRCHSPTCDGCQRGSIDRSLEDKPLGGRKKIVITATIAVDRREGNRERERERHGRQKKDWDGAARDQPSASSCLVEIFSLTPKIQHDLLLEQISLRRTLTC
jgi:hypothetical protein